MVSFYKYLFVYCLNSPTGAWVIISISSNVETSKLKDGSVIAPAWFWQVNCLVKRPVLGDHLSTNPKRTSSRDALNGDISFVSDDGTVSTKSQLGSLLAKVTFTSNGSVLLVELLLDDILFCLNTKYFQHHITC